MYHTLLYKVIDFFYDIFAQIKWQGIQAFVNGGTYWTLTEQDHDTLRKMCNAGYYFIVTRRRCHLTTYLIGIASKIGTGITSHYCHALMNVDDGNPTTNDDYKFIEATGEGVHYSTFMQIFDCDSVCLLHPRGMTQAEWVEVLEAAVDTLGLPYDDLFDITDATHVTCIEMCRRALQGLPDYSTRFANFEAMIAKAGNNLTPQMLYDCPDFERAFEIRR